MRKNACVTKTAVRTQGVRWTNVFGKNKQKLKKNKNPLSTKTVVV